MSHPALRHAAVSLAVAATLVLSACELLDDDDDGATTGPVVTGLRAVGDADAFAREMRTALLARYARDGGYGDGRDVAVGAPAAPQAGGLSDAFAPPSDGEPAPAVTLTNVQEAGVDESDRVKSDGRVLYVLDSATSDFVGPTGAPGLPEPTDGTTDGPADGSIDEPLAVPVDAAVDVAAAVAPYYPDSVARIRLLTLDPEAASAALVNELILATGHEFADGLYLHERADGDALIVTSTSFGAYWGYWESSFPFMGRTSTIRRIDVSDPASASVSDSLTLEGQIVSSRRVGDHLYVATRFFPDIPGVEPYLTDEPTARAAIEQASIETLLPSATRASDGSVRALADAADCFVVPGTEDGYLSPDVVTLAAIDLVTMDISGSVCFLGATETLYATPASLYLATTRHDAFVPADAPGSPLAPGDVTPERDPRTRTDIHRFAIDAGTVRYAGSGDVEGHLGWNASQRPFRLSERAGHLRVVTHDDDQSGAVSPVIVSVLEADADGTLARVGRLPNAERPDPIGKPREQLHATRFVGERAYLVTFLQTDPLYVVDLAVPADPRVAGTLEIDGYSDYLHPIGESHLLGIGKGAIPAAPGAEGAERGAFAQGIKLTLFDVADPATPREIESIEIGRRGTRATALDDHHGITVQRAATGRPTRVAFGIDVADVPPDTGIAGPATWYGWSRTGLHAFEIVTGANAGLSAHGDMIVERRSDAQRFGPLRHDDRSVIVDDAVYYVHGEQVYAASWNALANVTGPE